jgi:hypothetical protein
MIAQASPAAGPLQTDPSKRVNYTLGLVLGVDEFQQDQLYHAAGRRGHNRLLHGYGTVWGLRVGATTGGSDPEIQVDAGVAVDPCGREICVPDRMCVKLDKWLDRHQATLKSLYPDPTQQTFPLAVVLCHRECPTDTVPVPGEPCRSQDDAMQPSRIRDGFELKLMLRDDAPWDSPPTDTTGLGIFRRYQPEEQAVRAFGQILARVQTTTDELLGKDGETTLLAAVRDLAHAADESVLASPPEATDDPILLPAATAPDILREAFRVWVTEVRPAIRRLEDPGVCGDGGDGDCCVLLAEIELNVTSDWAAQITEGGIEIHEERRPYLLHTRLLQEWLIAGGGENERPDVDSWATLQILGPQRVRFWVHHDGYVNVPQEAVKVLVNDEEREVTGVPWGGIRNVWDAVLAQEMGDGDAVEVRFDTTQVQLVAGPTFEYEGFPRLRVIGDFAPVVAEPGSIGERVPVDVLEGGIEFWSWTPDGAPLLGKTIADELAGPSGEYLDRYGSDLSAFTVYNRLEGGDLAGEYQLPIVAKIQKVPVDPTAPIDSEQYLRFDGAKWAPQHLDDGKIDLSGRYPNSTVVGLQGHSVSPTAPQATQYLVFDGTRWTPAFLPDGTKDLSGRYPDSIVRGIQGTPVSSAAPKAEQYLKYDSVSKQWLPVDLPDATGDLTGKYPSLTIGKLQGRTVDTSTNAPAASQVLAFNGSKWVPAGVATLLGNAGGDLTGAYPSPSVAGLRGKGISTTAPQDGQVLVFRESSPPGNGQWVPGLSSPSGGASGDLAGTYPGPNVTGLRGKAISTTAPQDGQVLVYRESSPPGNGQWVPGVAAATASGNAGGDLAGTYPNPGVARLRGKTISTTAPTDGQVLIYRESSPPGNGQWVPGAQTGGTGATGNAGGDLTGTYPDPQLRAIQGVPVLAPKPVQGQYLMFDGKNWVPAQGGGGSAYQVVAAGVFQVRDVPGDANPVAQTFGGLALAHQKDGIWTLGGYPFDLKSFVYVVKGTAEGSDVEIVNFSPDALAIRLPGIANTDIFATLHLEVSAYPRQSIGFAPATGTVIRAPQPIATTSPTLSPRTAPVATTDKATTAPAKKTTTRTTKPRKR